MSFEEHTVGACRLILGDCREVLPTLGKMEVLITDPPYGIRLAHHGYRRTGPERSMVGDESQDIGHTVLDWARQGSLSLVVFGSPEKPWPGPWRSLVVWDKGPGVGGGGDTRLCFKRTWELVHIYNRLPLQCGRDSAVFKRWVFNLAHRHHPAEKPVDVMAYFIRQVTTAGQTILDPFAGSFPTGLACLELGRSFTGIEIERRFFDIGCARLEAAYAAQGALCPTS